jgi:cephalosporin hydroxylase
VWDIPNGKPEWKNDNPLIAIEDFLRRDDRFVVDEHYNRLKVTSNPKGFLRRLTGEEKEAGVRY